MKKISIKSTSARKLACTVSAAALMLGVSHAATVGFNFQVNYCSDGRYTGFPVTLPAFGVGTNGWENLTQMMTGYGGPPCDQLGYTLNQVVDTTTSTGGLNPLPNGSLNITWYASTANFSGFGGYGPGNATGDYGGTPPNPIPTGEWQVYSGFLRDGVEFGPGGGADNNQPGYNIDIVGLKTLFTNTPYVVELIGASDSMQTLTNAFVIDATLSTTQSVIYPNCPFPGFNWGGTGGEYYRGHGGGLSTFTPAISTDHLKIIGNRAQHGTNDTPNGFDNASCIAGFIITDQPVVSMSPRSVLASGGEQVTLNPYAIGVPPLSYQWRKGGTAIPGATLSSYVIASAAASDAGNYDMVVTNLYGSATSKVSTVTMDVLSLSPGNNFVIDSNPANAENDGYSFGATWVASSTDSAGTNRTGVMQFAAADPDQITVPPSTNFNYSTGTILFWMRSSGVVNPSVNATLWDRLNGQGLVIAQGTNGTIHVQTQNTADAFDSGFSSINDNKWHMVAVVFDQANGNAVSLFIDGAHDSDFVNTGGWSWPTKQQIELGHSHNSAWSSYNGQLDDVRFYSRQLSSGEIASVYSSGALVDTSTLQLRLNFDAAPQSGVTLSWQFAGVILQSSPALTGPWTDLPASSSPYAAATQGVQKYYRFRNPTPPPASVLSNPYMM